MRFLYIIVLAFTLGIISSCNDMLNVEPENSVTFRNYFKTEKDLHTIVNSLKRTFREKCVLNTELPPICSGIITDKLGWNTEDYHTLSIWGYDPGSSYMDWGEYYSVIASANVVLENIHKVEIPEDRINFYKGQAYFYRGYAYFMIGKIWGDAPIIKDSRDVGQKGREPWNKVIDFAIENAKDAVKYLPYYKNLKDEKGNIITNKHTLSKEAANCMLAYAYAWKASLANETDLYQKAIEASSMAIDNGPYTLASDPEEVCSSVLMGNSSESIFEVRNIWNEGGITSYHFTSFNFFCSWPLKPERGQGDIKREECAMKYETINHIYSREDKRRNSYFYKVDEMAQLDKSITSGYSYPYKYRNVLIKISSSGKKRFQNINQPRIMYRLADILLLRAECYARQGKTGLAAKDLNKIRRRAGVKEYPAPGENDIRYAVFKEREKELLWEGFRYFDVVRNGYVKTELSEAYKNLTDQDIKDGALFLPVHVSAFSDNPLMIQNKYWLSRY
jgi:tetratricopeptide (TPR) repeat protein